MAGWLQFGETLETYVTTAAIVVGGFWTYRKFVRHRTGFPIVELSLTPQPLRLDAGWLVRVDVVMKNVGVTLAKFDSAELRLRQILPLPGDVAEGLASGYDPVPEGESQIMWPCLSRREWDGEELGFEVEPGEGGSLHADFFVPGGVEAVEFYFYLGNPKKRKQGVGWSKSVIYVLPTLEESENGRS